MKGQAESLALSLWRRSLAAACLASALTACAAFDLAGGRERLLDRATAGGWTLASIDAEPFTLFAAMRASPSAEGLTVYIEGDGYAWLDPDTPSDDPTPRRPVGLRLALADPSPSVLYLARPCQYRGLAQGGGCDVRYWTTHRLSGEVISSLSRAIDAAKLRSDSRSIELIGYSGGGAAAALIAAQRNDVVRLVTVAANLDLTAWARLIRVRPLTGSLNPADAARAIAHIPQFHWVGGDDEIVPAAVARSFAAKAGLPPDRIVGEVPGYTHECCWHEDWARRLAAVRADIGSAPSGSASHSTR